MNQPASRAVILTGASAGIGEELAVDLARRGDRVALLARRRTELERVANRARTAAAERGVEARLGVHPVDVTDRDGVRAACASAEAAHGPTDLLILNAGIGDNTNVDAFDDVMAARTIDVNATSVLYALGAVLPGMVERRSGHIAGVASIASYRGMPGAAAYCASKACLATLLEGLRADLHSRGVSVTTISPGFVRTAMTDKNNHPMPFLWEVDRASRRILAGLDRREREIRFPWPVVAAARLLRALPDGIFDWIARRYERPASTPPDGDPLAGAG